MGPFRILSFTLVLGLVALSHSENTDERLFLNINDPGHPHLDWLSTGIYYMQVVSPIALCYTYGLGSKSNNDSLKHAAYYGFYGLAASLTINQILKASFKRKRPIYALEEAKGRHSNEGFVTDLVPSEKYSMPSLSLTLIGFSAHYFSEITGYKAIWYGYAATLAWSRIYEAGHYPADLLAGVILGTTMAEIFKHFGSTHKNGPSEKMKIGYLSPIFFSGSTGIRYSFNW